MTWQSALQTSLFSVLLKESLTSMESNSKGRGFCMESHDAGVAECLFSSDFNKYLSLLSQSPSFYSLILITHRGNHTKTVFQVKDVQQPCRYCWVHRYCVEAGWSSGDLPVCALMSPLSRATVSLHHEFEISELVGEVLCCWNQWI